VIPPPPHGVVNQFDAGGHYPNGKSSASADCTVAVGVMALDAWTRGAIDPSTTALRGRQRDQAGGIGLDDLAVAFSSYGVGSSWTHGRRLWSSVRARLLRGDGTGVQGDYGKLGGWRAPTSTFTGGHALYLESMTADGWVTVDDPLRRSSVRIPESAVRSFYFSGLAMAGYFTGTYAGAGSSSSTTGSLGQMLGGWGDHVQFPVGHILTAADVDTIMRILLEAGFFPGGAGQGDIGSSAAFDLTRSILLEFVGRPWTRETQAAIQARFFQTATQAGDLPGAAGGLVGQAVDRAIAGVGEVARNAILLTFALVLVGIGLYLVATATDSPLPSPLARS
jgi:hypothetical protein